LIDTLYARAFELSDVTDSVVFRSRRILNPIRARPFLEESRHRKPGRRIATATYATVKKG